MDHNVRLAIAKGLRRRGIDVLTAFEDGQAEASDDALLGRAAELGRVVFTQDDDFLALADRWRSAGRRFAGVVYAHQLGATVGQIVADLQLVCESSTVDEMDNSVLFLPS